MESSLKTKSIDVYGKQCYVGFCGKIYGFIHYTYNKTDWIARNTTVYEWNAWNIEETNPPHYQYTSKERIRRLKERTRRLTPCFNIVEDDTIFIKENAPIFIITPGVKICCPLFPKNHKKSDLTLKSVGFDKVLEANFAFNDLVNYISFLGQEHKEIPEMDNTTKIKSHGFDKDSFKK